MSQAYTFIATKTTYATTIPTGIKDVVELGGRVRRALLATSYPTVVGELKEFPLPTAQANFLLCDGSELPKISFQELAAYLTQDNAYQAVNPDNFLLPDYRGTKEQAPTYPAQEVSGSDVNTGGAAIPPTEPGQAGGSSGYNPPSGGRPNRVLD